MLKISPLKKSDLPSIKTLFRSVFTQPPWCDDWSDDNQLTEYLLDIMSTRMPLNLGLYENDELIGLSIGQIKHWCSGTEYFINEFCIRPDHQGTGCGTAFLEGIADILRQKEVRTIFLLTERETPAYAFYLKRGFEEVPNQAAFFKNI